MAAETIKADGSLAGVASVASAFDNFCRRNGLPPSVVQASQIALDEVLSNVVKSGFAPDDPRLMDASFGLTDGLLEMVVSYNGIAFDPLSRDDPDTGAALEDRAVGGLGIYLVKRLMDGVDYERIGDTNRLRMTKRVPA